MFKRIFLFILLCHAFHAYAVIDNIPVSVRTKVIVKNLKTLLTIALNTAPSIPGYQGTFVYFYSGGEVKTMPLAIQQYLYKANQFDLNRELTELERRELYQLIIGFDRDIAPYLNNLPYCFCSKACIDAQIVTR